MKGLLTELSKYVLSIILFLAAIVGFVLYVQARGSETQDAEVLIGLGALLVCAILSLPFVLSRLGKLVSYILAAVFIVLAVFLVNLNVGAVQGEVEFKAEKAEVERKVIRDLKDIRSAQEEYAKQNGKYAQDFDKLKAFINEPQIPIVKTYGTPVNNNDSLLKLGQEVWQGKIIGMMDLEELELSLEEAIAQDYEIRDTVMTSFYELRFDPEIREKAELPPVDVDKLFYNPKTGKKYLIKTGMTSVNGADRPWIVVTDPSPMHKEKEKPDPLMFGAEDDPKINGNWGSR